MEPRKGTEASAAAYCRKDGVVTADFGTETEVKRTGDPTEDVLNLLESGAPLWQIYRSNRRFVFHNLRKIKDM